MKTRNGFVSNSSSSSFIVVFPKKPTTEKQVHKLLFNGSEGSLNTDYYDSKPYADIAAQVFNDLKKKATKQELIDEFQTLIWLKLYNIKDKIRWGENIIQIMLDLNCYDNMDPDQINIIIESMKREIQNENINRQKDINLLNKYGMKNFCDPSNKWPKGCKEEYDKLHKNRYDNKEYDIQDKAERKLAADMAERFISEHEGWWYTILSYGDEDGQGLMEHGGIFNHIEHIRINHH